MAKTNVRPQLLTTPDVSGAALRSRDNHVTLRSGRDDHGQVKRPAPEGMAGAPEEEADLRLRRLWEPGGTAGQVSQLRAEVETLKLENAKLSGRLAEAHDRLSDLQADHDQINEDYDTLAAFMRSSLQPDDSGANPQGDAPASRRCCRYGLRGPVCTCEATGCRMPRGRRPRHPVSRRVGQDGRAPIGDPDLWREQGSCPGLARGQPRFQFPYAGLSPLAFFLAQLPFRVSPLPLRLSPLAFFLGPLPLRLGAPPLRFLARDVVFRVGVVPVQLALTPAEVQPQSFAIAPQVSPKESTYAGSRQKDGFHAAGHPEQPQPEQSRNRSRWR